MVQSAHEMGLSGARFRIFIYSGVVFMQGAVFSSVMSEKSVTGGSEISSKSVKKGTQVCVQMWTQSVSHWGENIL